MKPFHVFPGGGGEDESVKALIRRINKLILDRDPRVAPEPVVELKDHEMAMMAAYRACSPSYQRFLLHLARNEPSD
jgi:hypothetical protein